MFNTNACDGVYNDFRVHFTSVCDNNCSFCVDKTFKGLNIKTPDPIAIANTIIQNVEGMEEVIFVGGEPCLFLNELIECIKLIKEKTSLRCYVTTSVPITCYNNKELFLELLEIVDTLNISVQHYNEDIADKIRGTKSYYDRDSFYRNLPHKDKIRISINLIKNYLDTKEQLLNCIKYYNDMGYENIKVAELFGQPNYYASFEKIMNVKLPSAYSHHCNSTFDITPYISNFKGTLTLRRTCFLAEESANCSFLDGVKIFYRMLFKPKGKRYVVYEDGTLSEKWI